MFLEPVKKREKEPSPYLITEGFQPESKKPSFIDEIIPGAFSL